MKARTSVLGSRQGYIALPISASHLQSVVITALNAFGILFNLGTVHNRMPQTTAKGTTATGPRRVGRAGGPGIFQHFQNGRNALPRFLQQGLQIQQGHFVATLVVDKGGGHARFSTAAGTTNAMHVVFNFRGHVKVDDVLNVLKIQSLGGNIRGNQHIFLSRFEQINRRIPILLIFSTVNRHGLHSLEQQVLVNVVDIFLSLRKDTDRRRRLL
mmetsp:Transcript_16312/g.37558  ORF Transcript_16312/g.37558 Transcript_16312/m.37558 type:complete len:213 (+) Transcript_16312:89-727(+)